MKHDGESLSLVDDLFSFLRASPTAFHAASEIRRLLQGAGFVALSEEDRWNLSSGGRYFVERNGSAVIAFVCGSEDPTTVGFRIAGAHTDSPLPKLKPQSLGRSGGCVKVGVDVYGGPILSTWLDRELSLAGMVIVGRGAQVQGRLVDLKRPVAIIPNAAIHLNKQVNEGFQYNKQQHLPAVFSFSATRDGGGSKDSNFLTEIVSQELQVEAAEVKGFDLFLYDPQPPALVGLSQEFITGGRLDDLAMCHAIVHGLIEASSAPTTSVALFVDNEEIGSRTRQGADSAFVRDVLERVTYGLCGERDAYWRAASRSWMISADMAHGQHPNFAELHDPAYAPVLGGGPVVKQSATFRYTTTAESTVFFEELCAKAKVPCQKIVNRSDIPSGSTIGSMTSALSGIRGVDVGNALWGMHSIRETAGTRDHAAMAAAMEAFFAGA